ncbi:MAG: signal recognition particle receptor [Actinomycetota bacterium]|jgi:fused signal recognition particle receptor
MSQSQIILLVLAIVGVAFGIGVVLIGRRTKPAPAPRTTIAQERATTTVIDKPVDAPIIAEPVAVAPVIDEPVVVEAVVAEPVVEELITRSVRDRLSKARGALSGAVGSVLGRSGVDQSTWDDLEEALLRADVGVKVSTALLDELRGRVKAKELTTPHEVIGALRSTMKSRLAGSSRELNFDSMLEGPNIWLMVGVNGAGKTTSLGKIAAQQVAAGRRVVMAAGDTFRAAAGEQLATWAERSGAEIVRGAEGGDPSSVIFDAVQSAGARGADLVLADTAGRLQSNTNLMEELRKVRRVAEKGTGRVTEVLLVIDATTGQNGLVQARQFADATQVTGVVLTKLDGSAKGGIVFAIETELSIPVKLVGLGETIGDLVAFDPDEFVDALFD